MASDIDSLASRLAPDSDPDPDNLPLAARRGRLLRPPPAPRAEPSPPTPDRCEVGQAPEGARGAAQQSWPGLPRGVQFNPSDSDLLWHLAAEVGKGLAHRHPFISEFIKSGDEDGGFGCTHPQDMPGILLFMDCNYCLVWLYMSLLTSNCTSGCNCTGTKQDGHASYFFHKKVNLCNDKNGKFISWRKAGASISIILDGTLQGFKEVFVLYAFKNSDNSPQRTDWELHQYHMKNTIEDEGELVVSKIFYNSQSNHCERAAKAPVQSAQDDSVTDNDSKEEKEDARLESHSVSMASESNFGKGHVNNQELMLVEKYPDQARHDVLGSADMDHENQTKNQDETELDHMSLQERYMILLAKKHSYPARLSAETCAVTDLDNSAMQMNVETSGPVPKSESEEINHEGTACREDICSMLQKVSSAPSITDSMDADNNVRLISEIPLDTQISSVECFVDGKKVPYDPVEDAEGSVNDKTLNSTAELLSSQTLARGDKNSHLAVRNCGTYLVDVKMEPALEGYAICPSESSFVNSHHSNNDDLKDSDSVPECMSKDSVTDSAHAEGSLPSVVVKSELTGYELPGLCEKSFINSMEPIEKNTHTRTPNCNGGLPSCSRQRKKRKIVMDSSEKVLEEDAYKNDEGVAYPSKRRRKKKTATDSIETALEEDAPGLLQMLLDKGIVVNEIKLYDVGEEDEMLPDCTESDFQDLENVIAKLFPHRASLLKSAARHAKGGGKAIYCLACLISLIEQSRYLQFRDCPVEWGWCRDLQSFIFVFRSHNRLVLERPEYGYATYFFEIAQSAPIEWQIRRLVTAMKLSNCGRTALIEDRPLLVGEDLSEGEARVLEEYGWIPSTGLGTMLNYRDRVNHDRWNEKYSTDWRMKIGKLLMRGYSEGQCIITHVPINTMPEDYSEEIKLEDPC
ncbi:uncharacterized protein [Lolium perenne]|uniref:uncharacterized protein isoform X3 n=1 Tax=Lolium perenne TaxID=4522 RepID=UPI0021F63257|nr:uncharacterized protein LOC127296455 isoform X3 [Lolium perenne]